MISAFSKRFVIFNKHPVKKSNKEITLIKEMGKEWGNEMRDLVHGKKGTARYVS